MAQPGNRLVRLSTSNTGAKMGKLIITLEGSTLRDFELDKERCTIGRLPENDIHLDDKAASSRHAAILTILNDSFIEDLGSTNGTFVNGKVIKKHALQDGDVVTIGRHELKFTATEAEGDEDDFEKTMIIRPSAKKADAPGQPNLDAVNKAVAQSTASGAAPIDPDAKPAGLPRGKLQVLSGSAKGKELELVKALTTLGRPGVQVAALTRRADGFFIVPVESGEGQGPPTVNGKPIGPQAHPLTDNDVIELANVKMGFYLIK